MTDGISTAPPPVDQEKERDRQRTARNTKIAAGASLLAALIAIVSALTTASLNGRNTTDEQIRQERRQVYADFMTTMSKFDLILQPIDNKEQMTPDQLAQAAVEWKAAEAELFSKRNAVYLVASNRTIYAANDVVGVYPLLNDAFTDVEALRERRGIIYEPFGNFINAARADVGTIDD